MSTNAERAEALYQKIKDEHDAFTEAQRVLANVAAEFMCDFGALIGTTIPPEFHRFAERLMLLQVVTNSRNEAKRKLEIAITVSLQMERELTEAKSGQV